MSTTDHAPPPGADPHAAAAEMPPDPTLERFWQVVRRLPRYVALGVHLVRDERVPNGAKTGLILAGAYAVSPIDLVPGIIPVAGQLDDLLVMLYALRRAVRTCPADVAAAHLARADLTTDQLDADLSACRATLGWLAAKGIRLGGRLATAAGRHLWATIQQRAGPNHL